jgi:hypothetical protein
MTTQTNQATRGTGDRHRSHRVHRSVTEMRPKLAIGRSTIYDRRAATAPNPLVYQGGDR